MVTVIDGGSERKSREPKLLKHWLNCAIVTSFSGYKKIQQD